MVKFSFVALLFVVILFAYVPLYYMVSEDEYVVIYEVCFNCDLLTSRPTFSLHFPRNM